MPHDIFLLFPLICSFFLSFSLILQLVFRHLFKIEVALWFVEVAKAKEPYHTSEWGLGENVTDLQATKMLKIYCGFYKKLTQLISLANHA